jgi:hypothetical protein
MIESFFIRDINREIRQLGLRLVNTKHGLQFSTTNSNNYYQMKALDVPSVNRYTLDEWREKAETYAQTLTIPMPNSYDIQENIVDDVKRRIAVCEGNLGRGDVDNCWIVASSYSNERGAYLAPRSIWGRLLVIGPFPDQMPSYFRRDDADKICVDAMNNAIEDARSERFSVVKDMDWWQIELNDARQMLRVMEDVA